MKVKNGEGEEAKAEEGGKKKKKKSFQFPSTKDNSCKYCEGSKMWKEICDILSDI